ncbi:hypothetical protein [Rhizobium halophytocola]|uniref:Uncharacterized protein n=1 Tax=Rhizobium halophytocola TaxID=735519 RepID=A0ABS4E3E9_9HYPH|nr:hypothetical protein [Rhizobium halophytocola]MBP1852459.1 hypothetical protein [Rhizobium halophytocola]
MAMIGQWKAEWESKKTYFEQQSGKKKPSEKYYGVFRKGSGVSTAFDKMDKAYAKISSAQGAKRLQAIKEFEAAINAATKSGADYVKLLKAEAAKETTKKELVSLLDILAKDIEACITTAEGQLEANKDLAGDDGIVTMAKGMKQISDPKQYKAYMPGAAKKALMWVAIQERKPDVTEFNKGIETAARDITQNLANLQKCFPDRSPQWKAVRIALEPLLPWANLGKRLPADAGGDNVINALADLKKLVVQASKIAAKV